MMQFNPFKMQTLITKFCTVAAKYGLKTSIAKTMLMNLQSSITRQFPIDEQPIEDVESLT